MNVYDLELAGLRSALRTPFEITICDNLRPFLCAPHEKIDCTITLQSRDRLPVFSENGVWHGSEYYDCQEDALRVFHCSAPNRAAFAVTQLFENGNIHIDVLPAYLSYFTGSAGIFNRIGMETLLLQHQGLLLHASLIKYNGHCIAFAGPSGVGKSTQASIWKNLFGAKIINGDRSVLRSGAEYWTAFGSPYAGTSGIYRNDSAPLAAIVVLRQAAQNRFQRLSDEEAFRHIYPELSVHHWDKAFVTKALDLCLQLIRQTPVYLLECLPEDSAAILVKEGLGL